MAASTTNDTATASQSPSSPETDTAKSSSNATPYTPFSPFKSRSKSRENIISISATESGTLSSPTISTSNSSNHNHNTSNNSNHNNNNNNNHNCKTLPITVGSKTNLVASPDGLSIQLAPELPHILSPKKMLLSDSTTISPVFRDDVRQEWIDAMFGLDFFPRSATTESVSSSSSSNTNTNTNSTNTNTNTSTHTTTPSSPSKTSTSTTNTYTPPRQGVGLAAIPSYLSYTATIPASKEAAESGSKVGMTLSRIPIGAYVRLVDVQSEAYAAGIVPGSILIDINGMGVLGEPSHKLLERLWGFEGHFNDYIVDRPNGMNGNGNGSTHGTTINDQGNDSKHGVKETLNDMTTSSTNSTTGSSGSGTRSNGAKSIVALKLIKDGVVYNAILMAGSPFGISWAPCGNFALVQRTYALAQKAGVRRGCIVAAVNDKGLRDMNHLDTAMYLKDQFENGLPIRVVCVFTPAASRSGFHDRKHNKKVVPSRKQMDDVRSFDGVRIRKVSLVNKNKEKGEKPMEYGVGSFFTCGTGINYQPSSNNNSADTSLSDFDIMMEISNRVAAGEIAAPTGRGRNRNTGMSNSSTTKKGGGGGGENNSLTFSKLVAEYMSDTNSIEEDAGDGPSSSSSKGVMFKFNGNCNGNTCVFPKLTWFDIFPSWDALESLVFCLRMHEADYCEEKFYDMGGIIGAAGGKSALLSTASSNNDNSNGSSYDNRLPLHTREANTKLIKAVGSSGLSGDAFHSYLLQIVAFISSRELFERITAELFTANSSEIESLSGAKKKDYVRRLNAEAKGKTEAICEEITQTIVSVAITDDALCQSFHFLLRSFSSTMAKKKVDDDTIFAPIKMLTSAHCLLRNQLLDRDLKGVATDLSYEGMNGSTDQQNVVNSRDSRDSIDGFGSMESSDENKKEKKSKKRFGKLFRRGSKKGSSKDDNSKVGESCDSSDADEARKKLNFRPTGILRKSADQNPQDNGNNRRTEQLITDVPSTAILFENMGWFLSNLDQLCGKIEDALLKSFSQKLTEWALQPWNANKDRALADGTADMRNGLHVINLLGASRSKENDKKWSPVINPVNSSEFLVSLIPEESYILPSAHFPLLLTFNSCARTVADDENASESKSSYEEVDTLYRTTVKINAIRGSESKNVENKKAGFAYVVHAAVEGDIKETGKSTLDPYYESSTHRWHDRNTLEFETRSSQGCPDTVMFRLSCVSYDSSGKEKVALSDENGANYYSSEVGFSFLELSDQMWKKGSSKKSLQVNVFDYESQQDFDQQGFLDDDLKPVAQKLSIEVEVTTEAFPFINGKGVRGQSSLTKQTLLYKHDEDMRQEMLATQFLDICDRILKASGLDLKLKKYKCIPVGEKKGFIEWVPGAFSLSEVCKPMGSSLYQQHTPSASNGNDLENSAADSDGASSAFIRTGGWCQFESLRSLRQNARSVSKHGIGISGNNPVQDFFRSNAYDADAPYLIKKGVMDNFVKSCAGYSVITYLLGVGDRHTDNLLLHPKGYFLHCDYSFILGQDPKTYLPMRVTEEMVNGMGGRDSDNFAMFLSLAGAAFVTLRRHPSVRTLLSTVRMMVDSAIPDITLNQSPDVALQRMHERFRLDLNDDEAVSFLEENIERCISSRIWIAVDAIHNLGKRF